MNKKILFILSVIIILLTSILIFSGINRGKTITTNSISEDTYYKYDRSYREGTSRPRTPASGMYDVLNEIDPDTIEKLTEEIGGVALDELKYINKEGLPFLLQNLNGEILSSDDFKNQKYILFFGNISSMSETPFFEDNWIRILNEIDVTVIEIYEFDQGDEIEAYYSSLGLELNDEHRRLIVPASEEVKEYTYSLGFNLYPSMFFIDELGMIAWYSSNCFSNYDNFMSYYKFAYSNNIAETIDEEALEEALYGTYEVMSSLDEDLLDEVDALCPEDFELILFDGITYEFLNVAFHPANFLSIENEIIDGSYLEGKKYIVSYLSASDNPKDFTVNNVRLLTEFASENDYELIFLLHDFESEDPVRFYNSHKDLFGDYLVLNGDDLDNLPYDFVYVQPSVIPSSFFVSDEGRIAGFIIGEYSEDLIKSAAETYLGEKYSYERLK